AEMLKEMAKMPDGTQFAVFVFPEKSDGAVDVDNGHWVTAERYNGNTIFEDYQQNLKQPVLDNKGKPSGQDYTDAERPTVNVMPRGRDDGTAIYKHGMFFALKPTAKALASASAQPAAAETAPKPRPQLKVPRPQRPSNLRQEVPKTWEADKLLTDEMFNDLL